MLAGEFENLDTCKWSHPKDYVGFSPDGDYCVMSVHRDSDSLDRSNWDAARELLGCEPYDGGTDDFARRPAVYDWRAGHGAVGWVEYLMLRADAPAETLDKAEKMLAQFKYYPALDEYAWSELEWSEVCDFWESLSVRERAEFIKRTQCGVSIFAARRAEFPQNDSGALFERLRE